MNADFYDEFVVALKALRKECGFSQAEMAERIGVSQGMYSMMEAGKRQINLEQALDIYEALSISRKPSISSFLEEVRARRLKKHLSQADMAENLGVSQGMYSMMEAGRRQFSYEQALKLDFLLSDGKKDTLITFERYPKDVQSTEYRAQMDRMMKYMSFLRLLGKRDKK